MKKIIPITFVFFISIVLIIPSVSSWGPHTHYLMNSDILSEGGTAIGELCGANELNRMAFLLGSVTPDLSVIYYYEEGGKEYRLTHNWNFQQEIMAGAVTEDERCFAWGVGAHLIQDGISHTQSVPKAIEEKHVKNWILHPLLEKKYDSALVSKNPSLKQLTPRMMDALDGPKGEKYIQMIETAIGDNSEIDVRSELTKLRFALDVFYQSQFQPKGSTWIFKGYAQIDKLTNFLAPYIGTVNYGSIDFYYRKSKEQTISVFNNWGSRYQISPHGFNELKDADENVGGVVLWILFAMFAIPIFLAYIKRKVYYLLLIPLILVLYVVGVYALL